MLETNPTVASVKEQQETLELTLKNMKEVELVEKLKLENEKLRLENHASQVNINRNGLKNIKDSYYLATNMLQGELELTQIEKITKLQKDLVDALHNTWYPQMPQQPTAQAVPDVDKEQESKKAEPETAA